MKENNEKISPVSLIIGIICGVLIIGVTFAVIIAFKSSDDEKTTTVRVSVTTTETQKTSEVQTTVSTETTTIQEEPHIEEFLQGEEVELTSNRQYNLNIFLSNFSESQLPNFTSALPLENEELIDFAMSYSLINLPNRYENGDYYDNDGSYLGNARINESYIIRTIEKFMGITLQEDELAEYYYTELSEGHCPQGVSIVESVMKISEEEYVVEFTVYFTGDSGEGSYSLTAEKAEERCDEACGSTDDIFEKTKTGTAIIHATNINDRSTYTLVEYETEKA